MRSRVAPALDNHFSLALNDRSYSQQYASVYYMRLETLRPAIEAQINQQWADMKVQGAPVEHCRRVLDVRAGRVVSLIGTVYKNMKLKPDILEDVARQHTGALPVPHEHYWGPGDEISLEDESGRVKLVGDKIDQALLVTGTVIGVLGTETAEGNLEVADLLFAEYAPQPDRKANTTTEPGKLLAFVSGLEFGPESDHQPISLLTQYLRGELGSNQDQADAARICGLIIAGNSLAAPQVDAARARNYGDKRVYNPGPLRDFDGFLQDIGRTMPITVVPGPQDPTGAAMPQQPLVAPLFRTTRPWFNSGHVLAATNPCLWTDTLSGTVVLATAGQPLDDLVKYRDGVDRLDALDNMLRWRHCAPTAPDTLWCYPYTFSDPFVLKASPHIFVAGNQPQFEVKAVEIEDGSALLMCLPRFSHTRQLVLVDLDDLQARTVCF